MKARVDLVLDCADPEALAGFWRETLDYRDYYVAEDVAILVPKEGVSPPLVLQRVPEPRAGKNRMHLDIHVVDIDAEATRLERLGAKRVSSSAFDEHGTRWHLMADPEGNELCVCDGGAGTAG